MEVTVNLPANKKNIFIICFPDDFDKMITAFTIAADAAATNREVIKV